VLQRGRKKKVPPAVMGEEQAVAKGDKQIEQAKEATEDEVTADDNEGEEGKDEPGPRRFQCLNLKTGATLIRMVQLMGPDSWLEGED
jgi:hypothetical protein